jgi:hypothetical protein
MKYILLVAALIASTPVYATTTVELCTSMGRLANTVITLRQAGVPINDVMAVMATVEENPGSTFARALILQAYEIPVRSVNANTVAEFRNTVEVACYSQFNQVN